MVTRELRNDPPSGRAKGRAQPFVARDDGLLVWCSGRRVWSGDERGRCGGSESKTTRPLPPAAFAFALAAALDVRGDEGGCGGEVREAQRAPALDARPARPL